MPFPGVGTVCMWPAVVLTWPLEGSDWGAQWRILIMQSARTFVQSRRCLLPGWFWQPLSRHPPDSMPSMPGPGIEAGSSRKWIHIS